MPAAHQSRKRCSLSNHPGAPLRGLRRPAAPPSATPQLASCPPAPPRAPLSAGGLAPRPPTCCCTPKPPWTGAGASRGAAPSVGQSARRAGQEGPGRVRGRCGRAEAYTQARMSPDARAGCPACLTPTIYQRVDPYAAVARAHGQAWRSRAQMVRSDSGTSKDKTTILPRSN